MQQGRKKHINLSTYRVVFKDAIDDWCEELNDDLRARTVLAVLQYTHTIIAVMQCSCYELSSTQYSSYTYVTVIMHTPWRRSCRSPGWVGSSPAAVPVPR